MAPSLKCLVLLIVMVAATCKCGRTGLLPPKTTVQIINALPKHDDMTLHCKDKHSDLGEHTLKFGESFEFSFKPNAFSNVTLYFCSFWWQSLQQPRHFDIYQQERDQCRVCTWKISDYGPCLFGVCYPWNPPQPHYSTLSLSSSDDVPSNTHSNVNITGSLHP